VSNCSSKVECLSTSDPQAFACGTRIDREFCIMNDSLRYKNLESSVLPVVSSSVRLRRVESGQPSRVLSRSVVPFPVDPATSSRAGSSHVLSCRASRVKSRRVLFRQASLDGPGSVMSRRVLSGQPCLAWLSLVPRCHVAPARLRPR
jgi:hypothetical protein